MDDNATSLNQLQRYKSNNEALTLTEEITKKAKEEAKAKVKNILKGKANLEKLYTKVGAEQKTTKVSKSDLQKNMDMVTSKNDWLFGELQKAKEAKDASDERLLKWLISYDAQVEYINHLAFILGPYMEKHPEALGTEITALSREVRVNVKPTNYRTLKETLTADVVTLAADTSTPVVDDTLTVGELDREVDQDDLFTALQIVGGLCAIVKINF